MSDFVKLNSEGDYEFKFPAPIHCPFCNRTTLGYLQMIKDKASFRCGECNTTHIDKQVAFGERTYLSFIIEEKFKKVWNTLKRGSHANTT